IPLGEQEEVSSYKNEIGSYKNKVGFYKVRSHKVGSHKAGSSKAGSSQEELTNNELNCKSSFYSLGATSLRTCFYCKSRHLVDKCSEIQPHLRDNCLKCWKKEHS
ncbi:4997_t:CDS:1, partial [Dentiscutata erythropus]